MLDRDAFVSIPNCFDIGGLKLLVIVTGCKPVCWKCRETGHLSSSCPEKKASGNQAPVDQTPPLTESLKTGSPVMGMPVTGTRVVKPPVGPSPKPPFPEELSSTASVVEEKGEGEWQVAGRARGKRQTVGPQSPEPLGLKALSAPLPLTTVIVTPQPQYRICRIYKKSTTQVMKNW